MHAKRATNSPSAASAEIDAAVRMAKAAHLKYVSDKCAGITREAQKSGFTYNYKGETVSDEKTLARIKSLVIPPAWQNVWICSDPAGHLQATGIDAAGRKQYRYHPSWNKIRNENKFSRLLEFGKALPSIRQAVDKHLSIKGFHKEKILAAIVYLLEHTCIRIGNSQYEKLYGSFGLTTLKNKHAKVEGSKVVFRFVGKKGVKHDITLLSRKMANIIRACKEIPGKELFEFTDDDNNIHTIDSGMVNEYIKSLAEADFTAKDFRTWNGTLSAFKHLCEKGFPEDEKATGKYISEAVNEVAKFLGNTKTVCLKYYIHPAVLHRYESRELEQYGTAFAKLSGDRPAEELALLQLLEDALAHPPLANKQIKPQKSSKQKTHETQ